MDLYSLDPEVFFKQLKKIVEDNERLRQDILSFETRNAELMNKVQSLTKTVTIQNQYLRNVDTMTIRVD